MMVHILRVFGTPADGQWSELTRTPTCCGELGQMPFPRFTPATCTPWGCKYGQSFISYLSQFLQLLPSSRKSASMIASWVLGSMVVPASAGALVPRERAHGDNFGAAVSPWRQQLAVMVGVCIGLFFVMASSMWLGWVMGRRCGSDSRSRKSSNGTTLIPAEAMYITKGGRRVHIYQNCDSLSDITSIEMAVCSHCMRKFRKAEALKKGA